MPHFGHVAGVLFAHFGVRWTHVTGSRAFTGSREACGYPTLIASGLAVVAMEGVCLESKYFSGSAESFTAPPSQQTSRSCLRAST